MTVIGLTGGVGMGKSTSAKLLEARGISVCDTDALARQIVEPGQPALREIEHVFGSVMIDRDGRLRRDELAKLVFAEPAKRRQLEALTHPRILELWKVQLQAWRGEGRPLAVVVIPLLFETDAASHFEFVICVACAPVTQRKRLQSRGWSEREIELRNAAQWPVQKKIELANYVIWTEPSLAVHAAQLFKIVGPRDRRPDPLVAKRNSRGGAMSPS